MSDAIPSPVRGLLAMKTIWFTIVAAVLLVGCKKDEGKPAPGGPDKGGPPPMGINNTSLAEARKGFTTKLLRRKSAREPVPDPPPQVFKLVRFDAPVGKLAAYLSPDPQDGKKRPAIVWMT